MAKTDRPAYDFRGVTKKDAALLRGWLSSPHITAWRAEPELELAKILSHIDSISVEPIIVELNGKPIAYIETYDPHMEDGHPYQDQPFGTIGIDISIGDAANLNRGQGSAILEQLTEILFEEGATRLIVDPDPANAAAIKAYSKAGFAALDTRTSAYGSALMMALDNPEPALDPLD